MRKFACLAAVVLLFGHANAQRSSELLDVLDETTPKEELPKEVDQSWYSQAISSIQSSEYQLNHEDGACSSRAHNRANGFYSEISAKSFRIEPKDENLSPIEIALTHVSSYTLDHFDSNIESTSASELTFASSQVSVQYINSMEGMRQNFILNQYAGTDVVLLELTVKGAQVRSAGEKAAMLFQNGAHVYNYEDLHVYDQQGQVLESRMFTKNNTVFVEVKGLSNAQFPVTVDPIVNTPNATLYGGVAEAFFGTRVSSAGDVNGDGYSDIIVGAFGYTNGDFLEGAAFVFHGSASGVSTTPNASWEGNQAESRFGFTVSTAGDVNNDGYSDVIVGAFRYDNGELDEGIAYIYHGSASGASPTPNTTLEENNVDGLFGHTVASLGDANGDGYSDVIVGCVNYTNGESLEGAIYVYHGSASGVSTTASTFIESNVANALYGYSVASAGDVNGDGYSDAIVGAIHYTDGETEEGAAFVYHGSASGISTTPDQSYQTNQANAEMGSCVASAGDVNGDGYSDIIIGSRSYTSGESNEGAAFIYHGSASGVSATPNATVQSDQIDAEFGRAAATAGDVNGDGYADVIVGARYYDNGSSDEGAAFIYHGSASGILTAPVAILSSGQADAQMGEAATSAGDVNGDGYSDIIVGALLYDNGQTNEGAAFIYHGSPSGISATPSLTLESNLGNANFGVNVSDAGDINRDGYDDIIIGAYQYNNGQINEGAAFVYLGSASGISTTPHAILESNQANSYFGVHVSSVGDLNGDGYSDIGVGTIGYTNTFTDQGAVFIYYGGSSGISTTPSLILEGSETSSRFGYSFGSAGDVNGDGFGDFIVGAFRYDNGGIDQGAVFIHHGSASGISSTANTTLTTGQDNSFFGHSASSAGDVNGDGYADVLIGAPDYNNGETDEGAAFVYLGSASGVLASSSALLESNQANAFFGGVASSAGDVNGDGFDDVIVGSYEYDNGQTDEGAAFIYHGSVSGISTTVNTLLESNQANAFFGNSVSYAEDVNGDGFDDVIVGARIYDNGQTDEGAAFVFLGSASGVSTTPDVTLEANQASADMGISVCSAGDVNGDGYADVIVGARFYDNGEANEGTTYIYHGNAGTTGLTNRTINTYLPNLTTPYTVPLGPASTQFGVGTQVKSPMGRVKGAVQIETVPNGTSFGGGTLVSTTLADITVLTGAEMKVIATLSSSTGTRARIRQMYDPVTAIDGRLHGPWIELDQVFIGGDAVVYNSGSWYKGSGTSSAPSTSDNTKRILVYSGTPSISENATATDLIVSSGSSLTVDVDQCLQVTGNAGVDGSLIVAGNTSGEHGNYIGPATKNVTVQMGIATAGWHNVAVPVNVSAVNWSNQNTNGSILLSGVSTSQNLWKYNTTLSSGAQGGFSVGSYSSHAYGTWEMVDMNLASVQSQAMNLYIDQHYNNAPQVISATGTTTAENVSTPLYNAYGGWNLVANPYPGALDLEAIYTSNSAAMNPGVQIWNPATNNYVAIDAATGLTINGDLGTNTNGRVISIGQAFFVRPSDFSNSTAAGGTSDNSTTQNLSITAAHMMCGAPHLFKATYPTLRVQVQFDQADTKDEVVIAFDPTFNDGYQKNEDIEKFFAVSGDVPGLFVRDNQNAMAIAKRQTPVGSEAIPLGLATAHNGTMTFELTDAPIGWDVYLKDYKTKKNTLISQQAYTFVQDTAFGSERFEIMVYPNSISLDQHNRLTFSEPFGYLSGENQLHVNFGQLLGSSAKLSLINMNGQVQWSTDQNSINNDVESYSIDLPKGLYILAIEDDVTGQVWHQRIVW